MELAFKMGWKTKIWQKNIKEFEYGHQTRPKEKKGEADKRSSDLRKRTPLMKIPSSSA